MMVLPFPDCHRHDVRYGEDEEDHFERYVNGDRILISDEHLHPDKGEYYGNPLFQIDEHIYSICKELIERSPTHYYENDVCINDKMVTSVRQKGGYGVLGEN